MPQPARLASGFVENLDQGHIRQYHRSEKGRPLTPTLSPSDGARENGHGCRPGSRWGGHGRRGNADRAPVQGSCNLSGINDLKALSMNCMATAASNRPMIRTMMLMAIGPPSQRAPRAEMRRTR